MTFTPEQNPIPEPPGEPFDYNDRELQAMVNETAPKAFAVVAEWECEDGGRDACVLAWGLQYEGGRASVVDEEGRRAMHLESAERAVPCFARLTGGAVRLVWTAAA
jgi:hypothetical protein